MGSIEENKPKATTAWEELGISNDFLFGKVMQDPELCKELLQRILPELEIDRVEYPELQKGIRPDAEAKSVRLDVYVKDGKETVYDIEMQAVNTMELPKRSRYYQSMLDLQMIDKGQMYKQLKPCYVIFISPVDVFGRGRHIYTFENMCKEDQTLLLGDGAVKIFLNGDSQMEDVSSELRAFLDYVCGKPSEDSFVKRLEEAVREARKNREWRREYMTLWMRDQENIERGIQQGMQQGMQQGVQGAVGLLRDAGWEDIRIKAAIMKQYNLAEDEAEEYVYSRV